MVASFAIVEFLRRQIFPTPEIFFALLKNNAYFAERKSSARLLLKEGYRNERAGDGLRIRRRQQVDYKGEIETERAGWRGNRQENPSLLAQLLYLAVIRQGY